MKAEVSWWRIPRSTHEDKRGNAEIVSEPREATEEQNDKVTWDLGGGKVSLIGRRRGSFHRSSRQSHSQGQRAGEFTGEQARRFGQRQKISPDRSAGESCITGKGQSGIFVSFCEAGVDVPG